MEAGIKPCPLDSVFHNMQRPEGGGSRSRGWFDSG
jgi:hypothetical protein